MEQGAMIVMVECECCDLKEECTEFYINQVKSAFEGKWLCGLCSEAVRDEVSRRRSSRKFKNNGEKVVLGGDEGSSSTEEAVQAHMSFCGKSRSNPAIQVADGMKRMLRRISPSTSPTAGGKGGQKFARSASMSSHYHC